MKKTIILVLIISVLLISLVSAETKYQYRDGEVFDENNNSVTGEQLGSINMVQQRLQSRIKINCEIGECEATTFRNNGDYVIDQTKEVKLLGLFKVTARHQFVLDQDFELKSEHQNVYTTLYSWGLTSK